MLRPVPILTLTLLLAGCMGPSTGPVELGGVSEDLTKDREPAQDADCKVMSVDAGTSLLARIRCTGGTGAAVATLSGCRAAADERSWFTLETQEGRLARGNATATVTRGPTTLSTLAVDAQAEDGKETILPAADSYELRLEVAQWRGEWVQATVECPNAAA